MQKDELIRRKEVLLERRRQLQNESIRYDKIQHAKKIQLNCAYGSL